MPSISEQELRPKANVIQSRTLQGDIELRGAPKMHFGMQFYPLPAVPQTVAYAKRAMSQHRFERLWVPDHLTHENPFVTLAAILAETYRMRPENDVWRAWAFSVLTLSE